MRKLLVILVVVLLAGCSFELADSTSSYYRYSEPYRYSYPYYPYYYYAPVYPYRYYHPYHYRPTPKPPRPKYYGPRK